jgi:N-acetylmuramoyl-L-alanine amidase
VYPSLDQAVLVRDSNFVLGSTGTGDATLSINGVEVEVKPNGAYLAWLPVPTGESPVYRLVARRGADSVVLEHPIQTRESMRALPVQPPAPRPPLPTLPRTVTLMPPLGARSNGDAVINIRPVAGGTYRWFALPGTIVEQTGIENGFARIRLDGALEAYVNADEAVPAGDLMPPPRRVIPNLVVDPDSAWTDVVFPVRDAPPYLVEEESDKLVVTFYSARGNTDIITFRANDSLVRAVTWEPLANDRVRYVIHLRQAPFGYFVFQENGRFILRVRRPPVTRRARPLEGLTIAVDAGHPPVGSTGPTGLYEADATLPIAFALKEELEYRGAIVLMTRTTRDPVALLDRPMLARRANTHALVSIHLNAVPDGVNPHHAHGTGTYYFHPHSEPLARAVQAGMVRTMALRDLGVYYDNLALARPTWMPAVLCEGAFLIVPEQEAAMRDPAGQKAYARGVALGLEAYFRAFAQ